MSHTVSFTLPDAPRRRKFASEGRGLHFSKASLIACLAIWFTLPALALLWTAVLKVCFPGFGKMHQGWYLLLERNVWAADGGFLGMAGTFWLVTAILSILTIVAVFFLDTDDISGIEKFTIGANVVLLLLSSFAFTWATTFGDRDVAIRNAVVLNVADVNKPPSSLSLLYNQKAAPKEVVKENEELKFGDHASVRKGTIPGDTWQWEPRTSSLSGATKWLNDKAPSRQGVDIWEPTMTYVYGTDLKARANKSVNVPWIDSDEKTSRWSVIMDGSGRSRPAIGVAEWRGGQTNIHLCSFDDQKGGGSYKFTRAFNGTNSNNLRNVIGKRYPTLFFNDQDVSGWCDENDKPVFGISMLRNGAAGNVTAPEPACFLVLKGSPSGFPDMNCLEHVTPGMFPVPVYPMSLVSDQRDAIDWAAGRGNKNGANFGYEPSSYATQASNTSDYVLRSKITGGIYALTPSKFNKTKSQAYVVYQIIRLDKMDAGKLNIMDAYVLEDNADAVNPSLLDTNGRIYVGWVLKQNNLTEHIPVTFFSDGGSLQEFVPMTTDQTKGPDVFRGYGVDKNGATRFYLDISAKNLSAPVMTVLNIAASAPVVTIQVPPEVSSIGNGETIKPKVTIECNGKPGDNATPEEIDACMRAYTDLLLKQLREGRTTPAPAASGSPTPAPSGTK
jgi:hypothetical protein